ncbi:MAG: 3'(2'),5'-bisphosphate nucleotidase [Candidatus Hydrogenedentes bacterium]|nr:3'(2'),5'-bisphosphate nucleotidase [Candidatus Hydrogenedentota bacterium]
MEGSPIVNVSRPEVQFAVDTVRAAAHLARQVQAELVEPALTKDDRSPVTVADFAVQALVGRLLDAAFPHDALVGEEDSKALRAPEAAGTLAEVSGFVGRAVAGATAERVCAWIDRGNAEPTDRFWTLDPIDGTKGFLRGDQYAVALALVIDGRVDVGVLGCPNLADGYRPDVGGPGSLIVAVRGEGTWAGSAADGAELRRIRVSGVSDPAQVRLLRSFEAGHTNTGRMGELVRKMGVEAEPVRMDSQAKYGVLASGHGDLLVRLLSSKQPDYREKIWDQAAGSIVVEEAGGRITDLSGAPLDFSAGRTLARNRGVLASNGLLHDIALEALSSVL